MSDDEMEEESPANVMSGVIPASPDMHHIRHGHATAPHSRVSVQKASHGPPLH